MSASLTETHDNDKAENGHIEYSNGPTTPNGHSASYSYPDAPDILQRRFFAVATLATKRDGKTDKAPRTPHTLKLAETNDVDTLGTYVEAMQDVQDGRAAVCGPVLKRDGVICIDLDRAIDPKTGELSTGAQFVLSHFPGAMVTISASGYGLHVWIKAKPPFSGACENLKHDGQTVEILAEKFVIERWQPFGEIGEIKPFQVEIEALLSEIKPKREPAPVSPITHNSHTPTANGNGGAYVRAALLGKLKDSRTKMEAAQDGEKHGVRFDLARLLGGFVHYGHFNESDIENALGVNFGPSEASARKTIRDGIRDGLAAPLEIETPIRATLSSTRSSATESHTKTEPDKAVKKSQADTLIEIGLCGELFCTPNDEPHITVQRAGHAETYPLKSAKFRDYLKSQHFKETSKTPSSQATQDGLDTLAGFAYEIGKRHETHLRVAAVHSDDGQISALYLDLGDDAWRAVEIMPNGWQIVENVPVKFIRPRGVMPLPEPRRSGNINELRPYVNIGSDADFCLFVAWQLAAFQTSGGLPILVINGAQGSAKTSTQRNGRQLLDPNATPTRAMPRNARDLMIAAKNSATASFDNVSNVEDWLSDAMCSLATGAGFATRELHSDGEETLITAKRRAMLNGITGTGSRADFLDRCIILSLPRITGGNRRIESEIDAGFAAAHGAILGAILDAVAVGLRELPHTHLAELPRMADFAKWATACETGFDWASGTFMEAYQANLKEGVEVAADASPIVAAIRGYIAKYATFEGTTSALSKEINTFVGDEIAKRKDFPSGAQSLGHALKRAVTVLQNVGIEATEKKTKKGKAWSIGEIVHDSPKGDDVGDDVAKGDDVELTSSPTSSPNEALFQKGATPKTPKGDDGDDVQAYLSFPVSPSHLEKVKEKNEKSGKKENIGFTSSPSSPSSPSPQNEPDDSVFDDEEVEE